MDAAGPFSYWRSSPAPDIRHGHAFLRGLHFRVTAGGDLSRQRANDAAHHCHHAVAKRCRQIYRRPLHLHIDVRAQRAEQNEKEVDQLVMLLASLLGIFSFAAFFYLIDYASRLLRPISILSQVGRDGLAVIESVYPNQISISEAPAQERLDPGPPDRVIRHQETSAIVLAVNLDQLMAEAERSNGVIEFVPQVGDFVAVDEPLFNLCGGARLADEATLRGAVAFGSERTMEQDPTFAFRIIVDIALKGLSPAINDPTTAVLAIDQLHRMLRGVGKRNLGTDEWLNEAGHLRVMFRTPNWDDFVHLAFSEIRACGSNQSADRQTAAGDDRQPGPGRCRRAAMRRCCSN